MNVKQIREEFPVLKDWVYLDSAFVGLMPRRVMKGCLEFLEYWHYFITSEDNTLLQDWLNKTDIVRSKIADFIKVDSSEIAFTMSTGSGLNMVVNGTDWRKGDNVVFPEWEHNPLYTHTIIKKGVESRAVPVQNGKVELHDLEKAVDDRTRLVQVSQVSYINGFRFNLKEVAGIAHEHGAKVLVDATQAVGAISVDYVRDSADYVSFAPYKYLLGPTGLAFLYIKKENIDGLTPDRTGWKNQIWKGDKPEDIVDHESAEKFEYGTLNFEGVYALEQSLSFLKEIGIRNIERRNLDLSKHLFDRLCELGKVMYTADSPNSPIVSYFQRDAVKLALELKSKNLKVTGRDAHGGHIRVSVHFYNDAEDLENLIEVVK